MLSRTNNRPSNTSHDPLPVTKHAALPRIMTVLLVSRVHRDVEPDIIAAKPVCNSRGREVETDFERTGAVRVQRDEPIGRSGGYVGWVDGPEASDGIGVPAGDNPAVACERLVVAPGFGDHRRLSAVVVVASGGGAVVNGTLDRLGGCVCSVGEVFIAECKGGEDWVGVRRGRRLGMPVC